MKVLRRRDAEALVAVQAFLETMRIDAAAMPAPAPTPRLAATLDGRRPLRPATDPVIVSTTPRRRGYRPFRPAAVAIAASAMIFGGLATAGALPNPIQHTSAQIGSHVGIHLPGLTPHHVAPVHPVTAGPGGSHAPGSPSSPPRSKPKTATPATTRPTARTTPTTTPSAIAPRPPTLPTVPSLPSPIPVPQPTVPVKTPPGVGATLPSLPPLPITIPTGVIHH